MKVKNIERITAITNAILRYLSTSQLYLKDKQGKDINEDELLKKPANERDKVLIELMNGFLKEFAEKNGLWELIAQYGMTFAKKERTEPYFFDACKNGGIEKKFKTWFETYRDRKKVPLPINELLCRPMTKKNNGTNENGYWQYWKNYSFPMIILYVNNTPYFIDAKEGCIKWEKIENKSLNNLFNIKTKDIPTFEKDIEKLHNIFSTEPYSQFKVFLTSNFKGMHSQTFIKFSRPVCNINKQIELSAFINLCFLIDTAIGSVIYDFDRIINYQEYYGEILKHGTKAAMTAIMSRNLSHNIGSHVLSYWNQEIEEKLKKAPGNYNDEQEALKKSKEFFQYIQHRMDFLAEISTSIPCSEMSLDIEHDIFKPFIKPNYDKFTQDSIDNGKVSILLEGLAKSEGIETLHNKIYLDANDLRDKDINTRVSIPNGIIGTHAIYSILENFIRNAAKHYRGTNILSDDELQKAQNKCNAAITAVKNYLNSITGQKTINDDIKKILQKCTDTNKKSKEIADIKCIINELHVLQNSLPFIKIVIKEPLNDDDWKKDYLVMRIWDMREKSCNLDVVNTLRNYLPNGVEYKFTDEGRLVPEAWGIKEMITCANFLRKNQPEFLLKGYYEDKKEPPLFEILCGDKAEEKPGCCVDTNGQSTNSCRHSNDEYKNRFGVRLYLRKPKDLAVALQAIDKNKINKEKFEIKKRDLPNDNTPLKEEIPHRMLLVENDDIKKKYKNDPKAPCRIMACSNKHEVNDDDYLKIYKEFIEKEIACKSIDDLKLSYYNCETNAKFCDNNYTLKKCITETDSTYAGNLTNILLFVYHLDKVAKDGKKWCKCFEARYLQPISGGYSTYTKIDWRNHPKDKPAYKVRDHFHLELIESALTKVVIVDERISEWAKKDFVPGRKNKEILQKMDVYVVDVKTENNEIENKDLITEFEKAEQLCFKIISHSKNNATNNYAHFFVIHQGVLDKLDIKAPEFMKKIKCKWKVVDSGRGVPPDLLKDVRFVEISVLQKLLENFDKHGLVQTLFSARRPSDSSNKGVQ